MLVTLNRAASRQSASMLREQSEPLEAAPEQRIKVIDAQGRIVMSISLRELLSLEAGNVASSSTQEEDSWQL